MDAAIGAGATSVDVVVAGKAMDSRALAFASNVCAGDKEGREAASPAVPVSAKPGPGLLSMSVASVGKEMGAGVDVAPEESGGAEESAVSATSGVAVRHRPSDGGSASDSKPWSGERGSHVVVSGDPICAAAPCGAFLAGENAPPEGTFPATSSLPNSSEGPSGGKEGEGRSAGVNGGWKNSGAASVADGAASERAGAPLVAGAPGADSPRGLPAWVVVPVVTFKDACSTSENAETRLSGSLPAVDCAADFPRGEDNVPAALVIGIVLGTSTMDSIRPGESHATRGPKKGAALLQYAVCKCNKKRGLQDL